MKVVAVLVAVACFSVSVEASNVICGAKTTSKSVTVEDGNTFSFKTQKGRKYKGNTECTVDYKMGDTCAKMSFVCTKFNTNNKDKRRCSKGDKVTVTANRKSKAYCKTKKPKVVSTGDMSVVFTSDTKKHGTGAVCKVKCTEAAGGGTGCDSTWTQFGSHCYKYFEEEVTWNDAEARCVQEGGHLTSIHSAGENQFLVTIYPQGSRVWSGGNDLDTEGTFVWTDGSEWDYQEWSAGEPNDFQHDNLFPGGEDCTEFGHLGEALWNDIPCDIERGGFICKKK